LGLGRVLRKRLPRPGEREGKVGMGRGDFERESANSRREIADRTAKRQKGGPAGGKPTQNTPKKKKKKNGKTQYLWKKIITVKKDEWNSSEIK